MRVPFSLPSYALASPRTVSLVVKQHRRGFRLPRATEPARNIGDREIS
jgi:hypothetical protein